MKNLLFFTFIILSLISCSNESTEPHKPTPELEVKINDLESYFTFDRGLTVDATLNQIKATGEEKTINSKKITVTKITEISSDNVNGTFKLQFEGSINRKAYSVIFEFIGFTKVPASATEVSINEFETYFEFDKAKRVSAALDQIKKIGVEKSINSKKIKIDIVEVISSDDQSGTLKLHIKGTVNNNHFAKDTEFSGFAKTSVSLTSYEIGSRGYAQWSVDPSVYLKDFNLDKLLLDKDPAFFSVEYLKKFVNFYASSTGGQHRLLTPEEVNGISIKDIAFGANNTITFRTEYQSIKSSVVSSLEFDKETHYGMKITLNGDFISKRYMRGVFNRLGEFVQGLLDYDRTHYAAILDADSYEDNHSNSIGLNVQFQNVKNGELITNLHKNISGFKPLSDLKNELLLVSSSSLEDYMKSKSLTTKTADKRNEFLKATIATWIKKLQFSISRNKGIYKLEWNDQYTALYGNGEIRDVYLEHPSFTVVSSSIDGNILKLSLQLTAVNGESLSNLNYDIEVRNIK